MLIRPRFARTLALAALGLLLAAGAGAAPISMDPGQVEIGNLTGSDPFVIAFDGGDTSDNVLNFTASGPGDFGSGVAVIVFDDVIIDAGDGISGFFNPDNIVRGIPVIGTGIAAALLLDVGAPSIESFYLQLANTPSMATIYSLEMSLWAASRMTSHSLAYALLNAIDEQHVTFSVGGAVIPEPSSALVFGAGLLIARRAVRKRR